jgi:hypothetical protein
VMTIGQARLISNRLRGRSAPRWPGLGSHALPRAAWRGAWPSAIGASLCAE